MEVMVKKNNSVHLEGALEAFQLLGEKDGSVLAWASVVTLHVKPGMPENTPPSQLYKRMHHEVRVVAGKGKSDLLQSLSSGFQFSSESGEVFPCSVDGYLYSDGNESFVVCGADNIRRSDLVKTNGNNRVNILGEVVSTSYTDETATIRLKTDEGVLTSFISRRQNQASWDMVVDGNISKGDSLSITGPLLSTRQTSDGKRYVRTCMVSPHLLQKQNVQRRTTRRGVPTL